MMKRRSPSFSNANENATAYVVTDSPDSPEILESPESPVVVESPESPDIVEPPITLDSPVIVESPESPDIVESPESPDIVESPESPQIIESPESPQIVESPESPEPIDTGKYGVTEIPRVYQEPENEAEICDDGLDDGLDCEDPNDNSQDETEEYEYEEDAIYVEAMESPVLANKDANPNDVSTEDVTPEDVNPEEVAGAPVNSTPREDGSVEKHLKNVNSQLYYSFLAIELCNKGGLNAVIEELVDISNALGKCIDLIEGVLDEENVVALRKTKYYRQLKQMFPEADCEYLEKECHSLVTEEDCNRFINTVMITGLYPKKKQDNDSEVVITEREDENDQCAFHNADDDIASSSIVENIYHKKRKNPPNSTSYEDLAIPSTSKGIGQNGKMLDFLKQAPNTSQKEPATAPKSKARRVDYETATDDWEVEEISSSETKTVEEDKAEKANKLGPGPSEEKTDVNDLTGFSSDYSELFDPYILSPTTRSGMIKDIRRAIQRNEFLEEWIGEHTAELIRLFPNTDPSYLRAECAKFEGSFEAMNEFVLAKLERNDMPTRAEYEKRMEMEEIQNRYTTNFSIEDFLKVIPDPWAYFKDRNRNCVAYKLHSLAYLKAKFRRLCTRHMNTTFIKNKFNLYLTHKELENCKTVGVRKRCEFECNNERPTTINIHFLQEVAFIENEEKIKNYFEAMKEAKRAKFEEAKAAGALKECQCCFDSEVMLEDTVCCPNDHPVCHQCVIKYVEVEMGEAKCQFPCLAGCGEKYALAALQKAIKPEIFSKIIQTSQMEEIKAAGIEDLVHCPFCNYATIMPPEVKVMVCLNPECQKESCRLCKEVSHVPLRCEEVEKSEDVRMRTYIENKMTEALVRTCYKCQKKFVKEEGCNKMVCPCGAMMCYICRKPVRNYSHFYGQGGTEYNKCPLYSTNDELHVDMIQRVAEQAKAEVLQANPNRTLKIDPTMVLPERTYEKPLPGMQCDHGDAAADPARRRDEQGRFALEPNAQPRVRHQAEIHPQLHIAAEVHPVQEIQAHILPIQPEILPQVLAHILPEHQIQHEIQIQPQIQIPHIRLQPQIQIPARFYHQPQYYNRDPYHHQPQYQAAAAAPQAARVQRVAAPQAQRVAAPQAQRVTATQVQRASAAQAQRVTATQVQRASAAHVQRLAAPQVQRATATQVQRATATQAQRAAAPQVQRAAAPQVQRLAAPQVQRATATQVQRATATQVQRATATQVQRASAAHVQRFAAPQVQRASAAQARAGVGSFMQRR